MKPVQIANRSSKTVPMKRRTWWTWQKSFHSWVTQCGRRQPCYRPQNQPVTTYLRFEERAETQLGNSETTAPEREQPSELSVGAMP
mmetsp:Transcript_7283/g.14456  ORF Transcript_7283/g.14456 Transcript_7283/m.14456 type:complete len:86 (-) Transcript_7283:21-278(-)